MDKHRLLVPTVFGAIDIRMNLAEGIQLRRPLELLGPVALKDGTPLARLIGGYPGVKVNDEAEVSLTIAFDDSCGPLSGESIDNGIRRLLYATEDAIEALEGCLPVTATRYPWH